MPTSIDPPDPDEKLATEGTTEPTAALSVHSEASGALSSVADFAMQLPDYTKQAMLIADSPQVLAFEWLQADPNFDQYSIERKVQRFGKFCC